jgi:lysozyme
MKRKFSLSLIALALLTTVSNQSVAAVCASGTTLPGVDVTVYYGSIDWTNVKKAGIVFAYVRANDGTSYTDPGFSTYWSGMKATGIIRGAFSFFEPSEDATVQANYFLNIIGTLQPGDLPPMLDVEVTDGESAATIAAGLTNWIKTVELATGRVPVIYTAPGFWNGLVGNTNFSAYPLWAANWGVTCPTLPEGWTNWAIWQYSDSGTIPGIGGAVDLDEFNGSMNDILAFGDVQRLNIAAESAGKISISWSSFAIGYVLQQNPSVDTTNWVNVTNTSTVVDGADQVALGASTNATYFRLYHP